MFGGTGAFGELAYDLSLFGAPLTVIGAILSLVPLLNFAAFFVLWAYSLYLTYLGIQAGMNLPASKARYVILIQLVVGLLIIACVAIFFASIFIALLRT